MKQVLQNLRTGETVVADVPTPKPRPGMALVRTATSLVSAGTERMLVEFAGKSLVGKARSRPDLVRQLVDKARREGLLTTLESAFNKLEQPIPLGYSSAGTIVAVGEGLQGFQAGQRVACAGGGYAVHAEYVVVPKNLMTLLTESVDFESAAFTTVGAIALHGFRLSEGQIGERIAVIGLGLLGLLSAGIAKAAGCSVLGIDLDPARVKLAQEMGVEAVLREQAEQAARAFSRGRGCDVVLICADTASSDPVELAGVIARDRARVVAAGAVGLEIPRKQYYEKELFLVNSRSYGPGRYDPSYEEGGQDYPVGYVRWSEGRNLEAFVELLEGDKVDVKKLITHRFPIEKATEAYQLITGMKQEPFLGVLLTYEADGEERGKGIEEKREVRRIAYSVGRRGTTVGVRLGVLGAGNFASAILLPALKKIPEVELVGIASVSGLNAQSAAKRFGFRYAASDENALINDPEINTVAILTRHNLHARQVVTALQAGKHVFCEKPLAIREEELEEIIGVLGDKAIGGALLMVGFNRRFAPLMQQLAHFFEGRREPFVAHYRVNAGYLPKNHWTQNPDQGGGRIIGEGCHFVDILTFLAGASAETVQAFSLPDTGKYREDNVVITLRFPDGSLGTVSYLANGDKTFPKERLEVFCGGRVAVMEDYRLLEMIHDGRRKVVRSRLRQDKGHLGEWQAFSQAIMAGGPPPIPYDQIIGVMRATFAAVQSLRSGEIVKLSP